MSGRGKVLVTGGGGMLAADLVSRLREGGYDVQAPNKARLDIASSAHVDAVAATLRPAAVFNCAAFTKVDLCETDPQAKKINEDAVGSLAAACARVSAKLIHVSTDFVFDGAKGAPYTEDDSTNPLSAYGRTKLGGEAHALSAPGALVVRASWLFGNRGWNFVEAMLKQAEERKTAVRVVTDQVGRPTATTDLSEALVDLYERGASGIVHFANRGELSWNEFAKEIFRLAGMPEIEVAPMTSNELNRPARRPPYSVLSTRKYEELTGKLPRDFREPLAEYLARRRS